MIDIEELKPLIVERLKPLNPDKIILFGSYAYGKPNENSDIDLFLLKEGLEKNKIRNEMLKAQIKLWDLIKMYKIGFDVFVDSSNRIKYRIDYVKDQFYNKIINNGEIIYAK
jgi:predicted nucleotidyltransferase